GAVIIVSHDRYFIREIATGILDFGNTGVDFYDCGYEEYLERRAKIERGEIGQLGKAAGEAEKNKKANEPTLSDVFDKKTYYNPGRMETRLRTQIKKYEEQLAESEAHLAELQLQQLDPELSADYEKLMEITNRIEEEEKKQESLLERILETETELQELLEGN
ncbi:MAG: ABC transporter ATP-binding protein, partial [Lachnospiraceae bacterium]|nr:ABC transporter ATP-binding protein [Lachnospiraceae bacterium]